jgi:hypothetical protein
MKRFAFLLIVSLMFLLNGCLIEIVPPPSSVTVVGTPRLGTNYQWELEIDKGKEFIICNDKNTLLDYGFQFSGNLGSWRSYLKGKDTGVINGDVTLTRNSQGVTYNASNNSVIVSYTITPNAAPKLLAPSAIVIARIEGYSTLYLEVDGETFYKEMAVIGNCLELGL